MATVGVLCARGRVEENALMAALAEAGIVSALFPPADEPLPVGTVSPSPTRAPVPRAADRRRSPSDPADRPRGPCDVRCARCPRPVRGHCRDRRPARRGIGSGRARPAASDRRPCARQKTPRSKPSRRWAACDAAAARSQVDADPALRPGRRRGGPRAPRRPRRRQTGRWGSSRAGSPGLARIW